MGEKQRYCSALVFYKYTNTGTYVSGAQLLNRIPGISWSMSLHNLHIVVPHRLTDLCLTVQREQTNTWSTEVPPTPHSTSKLKT